MLHHYIIADSTLSILYNLRYVTVPSRAYTSLTLSIQGPTGGPRKRELLEKLLMLNLFLHAAIGDTELGRVTPLGTALF